MTRQLETKPAQQTDACTRVRDLGQRGCPLADAAEQVGVAAQTAETYVTLHHLCLRLTCEWLGQGVPLDALRQQEAELEARWLALNPEATTMLLPRLKALYEAWRSGHTLHACDTLAAVRQQAQAKPSGAVLALWCRLLRQAEQPTFVTALRGLSRRRRSNLPGSWLGAASMAPVNDVPRPASVHQEAKTPLKRGISRMAQADLQSQRTTMGERFEALMGIQKPIRA